MRFERYGGLLLLSLLSLVVSTRGSVNNWAVLVSTSTSWFNYRHMANTLAMYRTVKRLGIPDSQIILMLSDDVACNPRNPFAGTVYSNADRKTDLYGDSIEVDYKGKEVTVETFLRLLSNRLPASTPPGKRLLTDERSNIFVYMTGHGGDEFLKFQDSEEISAFDLADAFGGMWSKGRYKEIFFMIDTCQANTLYSKFYSPGIIATGSSAKDENSFSHHADNDIGVAVTDRFTHHILNFLETINKTSQATLQDLFSTFSFEIIHSTPGIRTDLFSRSASETLLTDFFGGVSQVDLLVNEEVPLGVHGGRNDTTQFEGARRGESKEEPMSLSVSSHRRKRNTTPRSTQLSGADGAAQSSEVGGDWSKLWIAGAVLLSAQIVASLMSRKRTTIASD